VKPKKSKWKDQAFVVEKFVTIIIVILDSLLVDVMVIIILHVGKINKSNF